MSAKPGIKYFYPLKQYPKAPYKPQNGDTWIQAIRKVDIIYKRRKSQIVYDSVYVPRKKVYSRHTGKFLRMSGGDYKLIPTRIFTGYRTVKAKKYIRGWFLQRKVKAIAGKNQNWISLFKYRDKVESSIKRKYPKIPIELDYYSSYSHKHPPSKKFISHAQEDAKRHPIPTAEPYMNMRYIELNTLFNTNEQKLDPNKLYSIAFLYYYIKITGYKHDRIVRRKSSIGNFQKPMTVYQLSDFVRTYAVEKIKEDLSKSDHLSFIRFFYFGAMTDSELNTIRYRRMRRLERQRRPDRIDFELYGESLPKKRGKRRGRKQK